MQEEVDQKTIALAVKTGKLTAQVLQAALKKYLQHRAKSKNTLHHGQQSLKQLKKHGVALSNIEITEANIGAFKPCAKKYGVDFTLRKDKTTQPPHYVVIFKSKDADNLEQAFREFTAKTLSKEQRPSIRKVLSAVKQKVAAQTKQRAKEKIEEIFTKGGFYDIPDRLVDAANAGGGPDNITALLLGVEPLEVKHG